MNNRARQQSRGAALVLALTLLPIFAWLSLGALERDNRHTLIGATHAELGGLRQAAMHELAAAVRTARRGELAVGETQRVTADGVTVTRAVAHLRPNKSHVGVAGLAGFAVHARTRSALGDAALRLSFVWRDDQSPKTGVWRLAHE